MIHRLVCALSTCLAALVLVGCASHASPNLIGGNYYMGGDDKCAKFLLSNVNSGRSISCYTSKEEYTETRYPMSENDIAMYKSMAVSKSAETAALMSQLEATSRQFNQNSQQILQQSSQYRAPAVNSYQQPSNNIRCYSAGIYTNCRTNP